MTDQEKTINTFIKYRWKTLYKPLFIILVTIGTLLTFISGMIAGFTYGWRMIHNINPEILLIGLPIIVIVAIIVLFEFTAYKKFISESEPFIPDYKKTN